MIFRALLPTVNARIMDNLISGDRHPATTDIHSLTVDRQSPSMMASMAPGMRP